MGRSLLVVRPAWAPARGCESPVDQMTETTSRSQLRRRETGWGGRWRRTRGPRNTNRVEGGAIRASQQRVAKPVSSRDRNVDAAGVRGRLVPLSGETCRDVGLDVCRPTPVAERRPVTRQESAEAVVAAGSCAAKGRTRSRGKARPCSRKPQQPTPPRRGLRAMDAQGEALSTAIRISPGAAIQPPHSRPRLLPTGGHRISPLEPVRRSGVAEAVGRSYSAASASSHGQLSGTTPLPSVACVSR